MIKKYYIAILGLLISASAYSQGSYNLVFKNFKMVPVGSSNIVHQDTVMVGKTYRVYGTIKNEGPDDYPGGYITFNVNIDKTENTSQVKDTKQSKNSVSSIPSGNTVSDINFFDLTVNEDFSVDTTNIIIVWPNNVHDNDESDNVAKGMYVYVIPDDENSTSIGKSVDHSSFSIYPNPAEAFVNVRMSNSSKGFLTLTDVTGKRLYITEVNSTTPVITIPLNMDGAPLANGVYFLNYTSKEGREVQKLLLNR